MSKLPVVGANGSHLDNVQVFIRARPVQNAAKEITLDSKNKSVAIHLPRSAATVDHSLLDFGFTFDNVLGPDTAQESIYECTTKELIDNALQGINGCIMAYGQTGAGKTYTMHGGVDTYSSRGLIPRAISDLFAQINRRPDLSVSAKISYLEIYNDSIFDLLNEERVRTALNIVEDGNSGSNSVHVRGLNRFNIENEEAALNYLFKGETTRTIAQHKLNISSSRSHTIFTIYLEMRSRVESSEKIVFSKLHLIDLAGSERVGKTDTKGQLLTEAKYINKSLTFLEQVVLALGQQAKEITKQLQANMFSNTKPVDGHNHANSHGNNNGLATHVHVPYRSSTLTNFLRDSLGNNSKTRLIANIRLEAEHISETISTLRFASRMKKIVNVSISKNVLLDPLLLIKKYERDIADLKNEITMYDILNGNVGYMKKYDSYSKEEEEEVVRNIWRYINNQVEDIEIPNIRSVREYYKQFKFIILDLIQQKNNNNNNNNNNNAPYNLSSSSSAAAAAAGGVNAGAIGRSSSPSFLPPLVGDLNEAAALGGGFGMGIVPNESKPERKKDDRDMPLLPKNIKKSSQSNNTTSNAPSTTVTQLSLNQGGQITSSGPSSAHAITTTSATSSTTSSTHGHGHSHSQTFSQPHSQRVGSIDEHSAFEEFKSSSREGVEIVSHLSGLKNELKLKKSQLKEISAQMHGFKQTSIDALVQQLEQLKHSQNLKGSYEEKAGASGEIEIMSEEEYTLLSQLKANKQQYLDLHEQYRTISQSLAYETNLSLNYKEQLLQAFAQWFQSKYGYEPLSIQTQLTHTGSATTQPSVHVQERVTEETHSSPLAHGSQLSLTKSFRQTKHQPHHTLPRDRRPNVHVPFR